MNFSTSWRTTSIGISQVLISLGTIGTMLKTGAYDFNVLTLAMTNIIGGFGLIFAKDKNVTGGTTAVVQ